jgi:hypothetical protein
VVWRTLICLGVGAGLGVLLALAQAQRQTPVYEARAQLAVPYESITGVDRALLPMDSVAGIADAQVAASVLAAWSDRTKARKLAAPVPMPFESELDALRKPLRVRVEKQAGADEFEFVYRASSPESAQRLLEALVECCLDEYLALRKGVTSTEGTALAQVADEARQRVAALEATRNESAARLAQLALTEATRPGALEKLRLIAGGLAEARRRRLEAENRFTQARSDLAEGLPPELIISRLPDGPARASIEKSIRRREQERDLVRVRGTLRERAKVWGPDHPRLKELQRQVADLELAVTDLVLPASAGAEPLSVTELLLKTLAGDFHEQQHNEQDLAEQLAAEEAGVAAYDAERTQLAGLETQLAALKIDAASAVGKADSTARQSSEAVASVTSPATVDEEAVSWSQTEWIALGLGGGSSAGLLASSLLGMLWTRPARTTARTLGQSPRSSVTRNPLGRNPLETFTGPSPASPEPANHIPVPPSTRVSPQAPPLQALNRPGVVYTPLPSASSSLGQPVAPRTSSGSATLTDSEARLGRLQQLQSRSAWHPASLPPST